jgi:hypothetical protein
MNNINHHARDALMLAYGLSSGYFDDLSRRVLNTMAVERRVDRSLISGRESAGQGESMAARPAPGARGPRRRWGRRPSSPDSPAYPPSRFF